MRDRRCVKCGVKLKKIYDKYICANCGYVYENQDFKEEDSERSYIR